MTNEDKEVLIKVIQNRIEDYEREIAEDEANKASEPVSEPLSTLEE